jgi:glycosyltransferase involved in cell wall biosynthesis
MSRQSMPGRNVCLISRQRIVGRTNGSSVYVLSIADYLKSKGFRLHYISPSPSTFGRWPFIRLLPEMDVFDSVRIRGSVKVGRYLILLDPTVIWRATLAVFDQFLARTGLTRMRFGKPAPYSIAVRLSERDSEFLASEVSSLADVLLIDYAFLTPCIQHVKRDVPSIVIMHDLFSARTAQFDNLKKVDSAAQISESEEMALLSAADLVVAIQPDEARTVRNRLPGHAVVVAPMAVQPAEQAYSGEPDTVLFVGSNTAPNIDAVQWLVEHIWPTIHRERPSSRLLVAGSVAWSYSRQVPGVEYLGVISDLGSVYRRAGVVVSPLRVGSGLKVKLVEAMGWGKAVVATSITAQGVKALVKDAVVLVDSEHEFANEVLDLMHDENRRKHYGNSALQIARDHFGEEACYAEILSFITKNAPSSEYSTSSEYATSSQYPNAVLATGNRLDLADHLRMKTVRIHDAIGGTIATATDVKEGVCQRASTQQAASLKRG